MVHPVAGNVMPVFEGDKIGHPLLTFLGSQGTPGTFPFVWQKFRFCRPSIICLYNNNMFKQVKKYLGAFSLRHCILAS